MKNGGHRPNVDFDRLLTHIVPDEHERELLPAPETVELLGELFGRTTALQRDLLRQLLDGRILKEVGEKHDLGRERVRQHQVEASFQLHLCLTAPWLKQLRQYALIGIGKGKKLPENTFIPYHEIMAGQRLSETRKNRILELARMDALTAGEIRKKTHNDRFAVNFVLKANGYPLDIQDEEWREIHRLFQGNALRASRELGLQPSTMIDQWRRLRLPIRRKGNLSNWD